MIFLLMCCTVSDCNFPWPHPLIVGIGPWIHQLPFYLMETSDLNLGWCCILNDTPYPWFFYLLKTTREISWEQAWTSHLIIRAAPFTRPLPRLTWFVFMWRLGAVDAHLMHWFVGRPHPRQRLQRFSPSSVDSRTDRSRVVPKVKSEFVWPTNRQSLKVFTYLRWCGYSRSIGFCCVAIDLFLGTNLHVDVEALKLLTRLMDCQRWPFTMVPLDDDWLLM